MKKFILGLLILSTLLSLTIICNATLIEDQLIDIPAEEEILPMMARGCGFTGHYEVLKYWPNNNVKEIRITPLFPNGKPSGTPYTVSYTINENIKFHGCKCPTCNNN